MQSMNRISTAKVPVPAAHPQPEPPACVALHTRLPVFTAAQQAQALRFNSTQNNMSPLRLCDSEGQAPAATSGRRQGGTPAEIALGGLQRCAMPGQCGMPVTLNRPPTSNYQL